MSDHLHTWKLATDQDDVGTLGVRVECNYYAQPHYLTILKNELADYIEEKQDE